MKTLAIEGTVLRMTGKALLLAHGDEEETWVPFSVVFEDDLEGLAEGDKVELNIAEWFCHKEGLEEL